MDRQEILLNEYNNLWQEKLIHKQSIRKFHNYLTYLTAIASLALAFYGVSAQDFFKFGVDKNTTNHLIQNATNIVHLFFIPFAPIVIITLTFPLNDLFHIYIIGNQIAQIEQKINSIYGKGELLVWEHLICPIVYGGEKFENGSNIFKITNLISAGDLLLLVPVLILLCVFAIIISSIYICDKVGCFFTVVYVLIVGYMMAAIIVLGLTLKNYTSPDGLLVKIIKGKNPLIRPE